MITKSELLEGPNYQYKHIDIQIVEEDSVGNVLVFSGTIEKVSLPAKLGDGLLEINKSLWDSNSTYRPPGYLIIGGSETENTITTFLVSHEWLEGNKGEAYEKKVRDWGLKSKVSSIAGGNTIGQFRDQTDQ